MSHLHFMLKNTIIFNLSNFHSRKDYFLHL